MCALFDKIYEVSRICARVRWVRRHFAMLMKTGLYLIECNPGSLIYYGDVKQVKLGSYFMIFITCASGRTNVIEGESNEGPKYQWRLSTPGCRSVHSVLDEETLLWLMLLWRNAPAKVNPLPPTRAIAEDCGDLFSLDFDPPAGGKSAQIIHDLGLGDQGVSGDITIRWSAVSFSRLMVILHILPFFLCVPIESPLVTTFL